MYFLNKYNNAIDRRSFIKASVAFGLGLASEGFLCDIVEAIGSGKDLKRISGTGLAMGTSVSMTLISSSVDEAEEAMSVAYEEIERLSGLMNHFDDKSPIARLNREGVLKDAHPDIIEVVSSALKYYRLTNGAFDISIGPVIKLFREKFFGEKAEYPSEREIQEAVDLVGSDKIEIKGKDIIFKKQGMSITLGGIAKGYIVDAASNVLLSIGIVNHLINAGGDIKTAGIRDDKNRWKVAVQDPMIKDNLLDVIELTDAAVATSGNYENYFDREKMFHHIVDPRTGKSPFLNISASVIAPTSMESDALATALLVMNPVDGTQLIDSLPQCESLIISRGNRMKRSAGWQNFVSGTDEIFNP